MRSFHGTKLALGVIAAILFGVAPVRAASLQVSPLSGEDEAAAGETAGREIKIRNGSRVVQPVRFSAADLQPGEQEGDLEMRPEAGAESAAGWVRFEPDGFVLEPGETRAVQASVTVPKGARPGSRAIGLFFQPIQQQSDTTRVQVDARIASVLFFKVKGDVAYSAEVTRFELPRFAFMGLTPFSVGVQNTGGSYLRFAGTLSLLRRDGSLAASAALRDGGSLNVLPGSRRTVNSVLDHPLPPFGLYHASLDADALNGPVRLHGERWIVVVHPAAAFGLVTALLAAAYLYVRRLPRVKRRIKLRNAAKL